MVDDTDLPDLPDPQEEYVCPDCGDTYSAAGIGQHWGHPQSDCEYPVPSEEERSILIGLWLAGGQIEQRGANPVLRKATIRKYPLDWLAHELGVWGVDTSQAADRADQQASVEQGFGYGNAESHQQYRLTTRACPFLTELIDADPADVTLTPLAARILYSFRGHVVEESAVSIRHCAGPSLIELLRDAGFTEMSLYEPNEGKEQCKIVLSAAESRRFAEWIGGEPLPGFPDSKTLEFRDRGAQGARPTERVTPEQSVSQQATASSKDSLPNTTSLEPDWGWLGACLTELEEHELAERAYSGELSKREVYDDVFDLLYEHQATLPTPDAVP